MPTGMTIFIIFIVIFIIAIIIGFATKETQRSKVDSITLGMSEGEMLEIMGNRCTKSLLKNNRTKYEFRFSNATSTSVRGTGTRVYSGVRKVVIYCKDGVVEEVRPYNV